MLLSISFNRVLRSILVTIHTITITDYQDVARPCNSIEVKKNEFLTKTYTCILYLHYL